MRQLRAYMQQQAAAHAGEAGEAAPACGTSP
jgi:hypothetical protein